MTSDSDDRRAVKEATDWLILLREEPDDAALRARFDAWRSASPAHAAAWAETHHVDDLIGRTQSADRSHERPAIDLAQERVRRRPRRRLAIAAIAALAACLMLLAAPGMLLRLQASDITATAELRTLNLEDGSVIQLGAGSAINVAFSASERRVKLLKGEAFFEVTPDASRPFVVSSGEVRTTVVGTSFSVRLTEEGTDVAVRSGIVRVGYDGAPSVSERLFAGDRVRIEASGRAMRGTIAPDEVAAWLDGQIVARDRSVADLVDELGRYHRGMIVIADGNLARERVTGVYNLADPALALRAVASAHGANVSQISPWLTVVSGK